MFCSIYSEKKSRSYAYKWYDSRIAERIKKNAIKASIQKSYICVEF